MHAKSKSSSERRMSFRPRSVTYGKSFLRAFTREKRYLTCVNFPFLSSPPKPCEGCAEGSQRNESGFGRTPTLKMCSNEFISKLKEGSPRVPPGGERDERLTDGCQSVAQ